MTKAIKKIKDTCKANKKILFIVFILIILVVDVIMYSNFIYNERSYYTENYLSYDASLKNDENSSSEQNENADTLDTEKDENKENFSPNLDGKAEVRQSFVSTRNNLEAIALGFDKSFRTYSPDPINIKIIDKENNTTIAEYNSIYDEPVQSDTKYKFAFDKQSNSKDREYEIVITYENGSSSNPVLYNTEKTYENGTLTINEEEQPGTLSFEIYYYSRYATIIFTVAIIAITIISILALYLLMFKNIKFEKLFVCTVLVLGLAYVFVIPMYRGHDEHAHFFKAYEISTGVFNTPIINEHSITTIPSAFFDVLHEDYNTEERYINATYYDDVIRSAGVEVDEENTITVGGEYMAVYSPLPYIPQALTIRIMSLFTDNLLIIFYMTRIVNLLVSVFLLYLAIKIIPFGKNIIFFIAIIPTTLSQIASVSPDALTITSSILFVAYLLKLIFGKDKITIKNIITLAVIGTVLGLCKIVYVPLALLTLLIPKEKYNKKRDRVLMCVLAVALPIIANLAWLGVASTHLSLIDNNKSDAQKLNILSNPIEYLRICFYTLYHDFDLYLMQLFGGFMEHIEMVHVGWINVIAYIIIFIIIVLFDKDIKDKLDKKMKITISIVLFIICGLIYTSIYMQWSTLKNYYINGVQGRYFIELLLPFMLVLGQNKLVKESGKINLVKVIVYSGVLLNAVAILTAVITYI